MCYILHIECQRFGGTSAPPSTHLSTALQYRPIASYCGLYWSQNACSVEVIVTYTLLFPPLKPDQMEFRVRVVFQFTSTPENERILHLQVKLNIRSTGLYTLNLCVFNIFTIDAFT